MSNLEKERNNVRQRTEKTGQRGKEEGEERGMEWRCDGGREEKTNTKQGHWCHVEMKRKEENCEERDERMPKL